jgi:FeS assembly SUF system protein
MNTATHDAIVEKIKGVYDPEIPVNIYDLGLIYDIKCEEGVVNIDMTLTSAFCPAAEQLPKQVKDAVSQLENITDVQVNIVWNPQWTQDMISDEAKLELGIY